MPSDPHLERNKIYDWGDYDDMGVDNDEQDSVWIIDQEQVKGTVTFRPESNMWASEVGVIYIIISCALVLLFIIFSCLCAKKIMNLTSDEGSGPEFFAQEVLKLMDLRKNILQLQIDLIGKSSRADPVEEPAEAASLAPNVDKVSVETVDDSSVGAGLVRSSSDSPLHQLSLDTEESINFNEAFSPEIGNSQRLDGSVMLTDGDIVYPTNYVRHGFRPGTASPYYTAAKSITFLNSPLFTSVQGNQNRKFSWKSGSTVMVPSGHQLSGHSRPLSNYLPTNDYERLHHQNKTKEFIKQPYCVKSLPRPKHLNRRYNDLSASLSGTMRRGQKTHTESKI